MKYAFKKYLYKLAIPVFDILGYVLFLTARLFRKKAPRDPKNILVVRLDHIGDFICTTPLFKNIKSRFPGSKITVLINAASKDLAYRNPNIDKVITFSPLHLARSGEPSNLGGLRRVIRDVRNIGFDIGIDPRGDVLSILIMWLGGVKYRIGYGITGGGFLLNKMRGYDESKHVIDRNLALLEDLDIPVSNRSPEVYFSEKDADEIEKMFMDSRPSTSLRACFRGNDGRIPALRLRSGHAFAGMTQEEGKGENGVRPNQCEIGALGLTPFSAVVIHPFAGAKAKEWRPENFQNLINRIKKDGQDVLLIGSANDEGRYENVIDLKGKITLPQLAYLIKRTGYFIGLDSGPANIAAALNIPSVIICSGTNIPQLWIPNNSNVRFVCKDTECKPCGNRICPKEKHECMESITVEEVFDKFKETASR